MKEYKLFEVDHVRLLHGLVEDNPLAMHHHLKLLHELVETNLLCWIIISKVSIWTMVTSFS